MVEGLHLRVQIFHIGVVHRLLAPGGLGHLLDELARRVPKGGGAVEHRGSEGIVHMVQEQLGRLDLYVVIGVVILPRPGKVVLVLL